MMNIIGEGRPFQVALSGCPLEGAAALEAVAELELEAAEVKAIL